MTENINNGCSQRDSAQPKLLETILYKDNFNRAYKRVKANKGTHSLLEYMSSVEYLYEDRDIEEN